MQKNIRNCDIVFATYNQDKMLKILSATVNMEPNKEGFDAAFNETQKVYREQENKSDKVVVLPVRLDTADAFICRRNWMEGQKTTLRKRICSLAIIKDKKDKKFLWPVFTHGYDVVSEESREMMMEICGNISLKKMGQPANRELFVASIDIFDAMDEKWNAANFLLFQEEAKMLNEENCYMFFKKHKMR